jgi:hypothetical protein
LAAIHQKKIKDHDFQKFGAKNKKEQNSNLVKKAYQNEASRLADTKMMHNDVIVIGSSFNW